VVAFYLPRSILPSDLDSFSQSTFYNMNPITKTPYGGPIFDVQSHAIKPSSYEAITAGVRASVGLTDGTIDVIVNDICKKLADDLEGGDRLKALGRDGIQVVTINTFFPALPPQIMLKIVQDLNVWASEKTAGNPQLIGIASIPSPPFLAKAGLSPDGESWAVKGVSGLRHAIEALGLKGVLFASNYDGVFLGDAVFNPYFALAEELGVPIIIHPAIESVDAEFVRRKNIPTYSGYLNDQRTTLLDLVMAGTYEKYPKLTIIATHLGGGILTSLGRFKVLSTRFPTDSWYIDLSGNERLLPNSIDHYVKKIYFDCNNSEVADIHHAISVVGIEHLLTGTDFPWTDDTFTRDILGRLDDVIRKKIAYENASKIFGNGATAGTKTQDV
jgi:predicted TIM-barrel fold metal-dependent hydrolase